MAEIRIFQSSRDAVSLGAGDELFAEGDPGDAMYAVVEGEFEIVRGDRVVDRVGAGSVIGELALIDAEPRSATARAAGAAKVVRVDAAQFTRLVQEHPTFALQVMAVMADRLRGSNAAMDRASADAP